MPYAYATTTCTVNLGTTTCVSVTATSTPQVVQDAGDVQYLLGWIIFFMAMIFLGMVWNVVPFNKGI